MSQNDPNNEPVLKVPPWPPGFLEPTEPLPAPSQGLFGEIDWSQIATSTTGASTSDVTYDGVLRAMREAREIMKHRPAKCLVIIRPAFLTLMREMEEKGQVTDVGVGEMPDRLGGMDVFVYDTVEECRMKALELAGQGVKTILVEG